MTRTKQIVVEIDAKGNCSIEGKEFVGPECSYFMNEVEELIGKTVSQTDKPEYNQRCSETGRNRELGSR